MNQYITGTVIKELRNMHNMTQMELAERLGVSAKTVSKWETGKHWKRPLKCCLAIDCKEDWKQD